jgi:hypothetical protein
VPVFLDTKVDARTDYLPTFATGLAQQVVPMEITTFRTVNEFMKTPSNFDLMIPGPRSWPICLFIADR